MKSSANSHSSASTRNLINPPDAPNELVRQALYVLRAGRIADAHACLQRLSKETPLEQAWSAYVHGRILLEEGDFVRAKAFARQAASTALSLGLSAPANPSIFRLAAAALELQGAALRRQDEPEEATRIHLAAFDLRREHGTPEEQFESAMSLGSSAEWTGDLTLAEQWYRRALSLDLDQSCQAAQVSSALIRLSHLLSKQSRHQEAVETAKRAQELLNKQIPGELIAVSASLNTTQALIRLAEHRLAEDSNTSLSALSQAATLLESTYEALSAFGAKAALDLEWCGEQIDFIERLRQAMDANPTIEKQA